MQIWALIGNATLNLTTSGGHVQVEITCTLDQPGAPRSFPTTPPTVSPLKLLSLKNTYTNTYEGVVSFL